MAQIVKGAPDGPSFEELNRAAEEAAGVPPDQELYAEWAPQAETVEEPSVTPEEAPEAPTEPEEAPEDTPEVHPEQEQLPVEPEADPLAELNKKLGQVINDNAELRKQLADSQPQEQQYTAPMTDVAWFDEMAEQNPAGAAGWALENGQAHLYDRAVRTWHDIDPVAAGRFERQVENAALRQTLEQSIAPQLQGANDMRNRSELEGAMNAVAGRHDDYADVMGTMTPDTIQTILGSGLPVQILEQGLQGDQTAKEQVFETLYRWQKAEVAGQLQIASQNAKGEQDEEARNAKREAFVGSASTTTPDQVPVSESERMSQAWADEDRSLSKGWKGQDSRRAR